MPTGSFTDVHKHVCTLQLALCGGGMVVLCTVLIKIRFTYHKAYHTSMFTCMSASTQVISALS